MIRASIDIGSNSVLLLAAEFDSSSQSITKEILNLSFVTSLGKDLDKNKVFLPETMQATFDALTHYKERLTQINFKAQEVFVTATEASRVALNAADFFTKVKNELGFSVRIISAADEAYYTAIGVLSSLKKEEDEPVIIMDMGGASTELIRVNGRTHSIESSYSLGVGSVRATDWKALGEFEARMQKILSMDFSPYMAKQLVCVAGSMTSLGAIYKGCLQYDDQKIEGMTMEFSNFKNFSYDLKRTNVENLLLLFPYLGKRAPMLAAASEVAVQIGEKLAIEKLRISTRGLRYGSLIKGDDHGRN